jgi:hypothetical protein
MSLGQQNIIQQGNSSLTEKQKSPEDIFNEMTFAVSDEPVCEAAEQALQPIFALTHTVMWLHFENHNVF